MTHPRRALAALAELQAARTIKFNYRQDGIEREGFLVHFQDSVVAFENACRHIPIPLDYGDGRFFRADGQYLICQTHGATYEPLTGECLFGPCVGAHLKKLPVELADGKIWLLLEPGIE